MSGETFHILQRLAGSGTEKQVVLQCAPLLTGIKLSNLLNVRTDQKEEVFRLFAGTAVSCRVLYEFDGRMSLLLYREDRMRAHLERSDVRRMLDGFGYAGMGIKETLLLLSIRYQEHMDGLRAFPHEIGLLLGYPPVDVAGFMENNGERFLYSGYWKVYGNLAETLKVFEQYDRAREYVIHMAGSGRAIREILAAS
ncbi:MAG TPA: DUF3793 family protein [Candidatus Copromonas faecavium]|uniref:DUF3793 family protein n=1 Tax=Candidatus Copromonas faecavium (nom. illeg.) TaxID=2840740 RepID=A0A9D1D427_9FIRM|nr:DUF3793 family protein [Candidatus Copromonas faecavium]